MLEVRKATEADLKDEMKVIHDTIRYFKSANIPQWLQGYPDAHTIASDIAAGNSYVVVEDGEIVATGAIIAGDDPNYATITNGAWLREGSYVVIHRVAVRDDRRGYDMPSHLYIKAEEIAKEKGIRSVRADTHPMNRYMRELMKKRGYSTCGLVYMADGTPRIAYQNLL